MSRKVTLKNSVGTSRGRVKSMQFSYDNPSYLPAYPGKKSDNAAVALRNILIYCELAHTYDKTGREIKESISKRYAMPINTINSIYYKTAERFRRWREQWNGIGI